MNSQKIFFHQRLFYFQVIVTVKPTNLPTTNFVPKYFKITEDLELFILCPIHLLKQEILASSCNLIGNLTLSLY